MEILFNKYLLRTFQIILLFLILSINANASLILFNTQEDAQQHCPNDEVVWLNTATGVWHTKWQHWYGITKHGAYVCKQEAANAGDRASLRG